MKLFSIRDSKAEAFMPPAVFRNVGDAIRAVCLQKSNPDSLISKCPDDFALFELGTWNEITGIHEPLEQPYCIGILSALQ